MKGSFLGGVLGCTFIPPCAGCVPAPAAGALGGTLIAPGAGCILPAPAGAPCARISNVLNLSIKRPNAIDAVATAAWERKLINPPAIAPRAEMHWNPPAINVRTMTNMLAG